MVALKAFLKVVSMVEKKVYILVELKVDVMDGRKVGWKIEKLENQKAEQ
jgi:hypothetical protein